MPRPDLDFLRAQIIDTYYLTRTEVAKLKYWNEEKLLETLSYLEGFAEIDAEYADESEDTGESYGFDDYSREDFYDEDFWYEYEAVIDYGND